MGCVKVDLSKGLNCTNCAIKYCRGNFQTAYTEKAFGAFNTFRPHRMHSIRCAAYCYTCLCVCPSVSVSDLSTVKTAESIEMPFGVYGRGGQGTRPTVCFNRGSDPPEERAFLEWGSAAGLVLYHYCLSLIHI